MTKRLLALFLTLVMVLQPVLPAAAEAAGEAPADLSLEQTLETTEEATEETTEATEETTEATEETTEATEETTEATEETTEATEEPTEATEETTEATEEPTEATEPEASLQGKGTEEEPYVLSSAQELEAMALLVNGGEEGYAEAHYVLGADLQLGNHTPIGTEDHPFRGSFDGSGHHITGLAGGKGKYWGLFGVAEAASLSGIALEEVTVSGCQDMTAGAIAGLLRDSTLERSYAAGSMEAGGKSCLLGGLVGQAEDSVISESFVRMTILGYKCAGGLAAQARGTRFFGCYAAGEITCSDGGDFEALAGKAEAETAFDNCFQVDLPGEHGRFLTVKEACEDLFPGMDSDVWEMGPESYPFPVLAACPYTGSGYQLPDMEEHATGFIEEGSPRDVPMSNAYAKNAGSFPTRYTTPNLPAVRDQGVFGTCWAHSQVAGAEVSLIKKGLASSSINLSEAQLAWFHHKGTKNSSNAYEDPLNNFSGDHNEYPDSYNDSIDAYTTFDGDNYVYGTYSMASGIGLMEEDSRTRYTTSNLMSIDRNGLPYSYAFSKDVALLQNARQIPMNAGINVIKQAVLDYGGVGINYNHDSRFITGGNKYYYCSDTYGTNHAVFLVGWDDTISRSNFRDSYDSTTPSRDGAWIIRNSWGDDWGNDGYFYMSYDTSYVTSSAYTGFAWEFTRATDDTYLYQYDGTESRVGYTISASGGVSYANVFTAQGNESLEAVSFWMPNMTDVNYRIDVYLNCASGRPDSGTRAATVSGKTNLAGYYTAKLSSPVQISKGTRFSLVMTLSGRSSYSIPFDESSNYSWTSAVSGAKSGQSYLYWSGAWQDTYSSSTFGIGNFRIKGLVTRQSSAPTQDNVITASNITLTSDATKAQTVSLNASALGGAALSYSSNNSSVTVSSSGVVTVAKGFAGTATITITAAATSAYRQTSKNITVTVNEAPYNIITASDITLTVDATKAQTVSLNASALDGAALSYSSNNSSVTVSSSGTATVAKGFAGEVKITITAAATSRYRQTNKVIRLTVRTNADIRTGSLSAVAGTEITVPVTLSANPGIAGFALKVRYDSKVLTLKSITAGSLIAGNGTLSTNGDIVTWYTADNMTGTGELLKLNFTVKADAAEGDTEVFMSLLDNTASNLSDENGHAVRVNFYSGNITVTRGIPGDVNEDGAVTIADVVMLNRAVMGKVTLSNTARQLSDVNSDGAVTIADVVKLNRFVLKKIPTLTEQPQSTRIVGETADETVSETAGETVGETTGEAAEAAGETGTQASVTVDTVTGKPGQTVTVPVKISGNPGIAGYSLQVNFDANALTLNSMTAGSLIAGSGSFSVNEEDHVVNWYTSDNLHGDGELLKLNFTVKNSAAEGSAAVAVLLNDGLASNLANENAEAIPAVFHAGGVQIVRALGGTFGNLTWELDGSGTMTVSGSGEMDHASVYPWEAYQSSIRKIVIEEGVTSIGIGAFSFCEALERVELANSVRTIEQNAFWGASRLETIVWGTGLETIGRFAFDSCALKDVTIPKSVKQLDSGAFRKNTKLQNIRVEQGNTAYYDEDGVLFDSSRVTLIAYPGGRTGSFTVSGRVRTLEAYAFDSSRLTEVVLSSGLTTIGEDCFNGSSISRIVLPDSLTRMGATAFMLCGNLETITVPGSLSTIPVGAFKMSGLRSVTLEEGITTIGEDAFLSCSLTGVSVPSTVTSIGTHALGYDVDGRNYKKVSGFTITAMEGSAAQQYAQNNGFAFEKIPMMLQLDVPDTVSAGNTAWLSAQVVPAQYDTGWYQWSLKNPEDAAYVTLRGNQFSVAKTLPEQLDVTVVCVNGSLRAERTIRVVPALTGITICRNGEPVTSLTVDVNEDPTVTLTVKAVPEGARLDPSWSWSDSRGAFGRYYPQADGTIRADLFTNAKLGTVTLTVKDAATKKSAAVKLTTTRKSTDLWIYSIQTLTGGSSVQMKAACEGSPANSKITWSLAEEYQAYASITPAGKLTAAQVTEEHEIVVRADAADGGSYDECWVTLVPKAQGISLRLNGKAAEKVETVYLNNLESLTLEASSWPEGASQNVTWSVPKNQIAEGNVVNGKLYLGGFTGQTGTITVKATTTDGSKKTASVQLKFARKPDYLYILDSKGQEIDGPVVLKGKQSCSFKMKMGTYNGQKITDKDVVWAVDSNDGFVTVKNGKLTVKSFASNGPVEAWLMLYLKSDPEVCDLVELELQPDAASGVYIFDKYGKGLVNNTTYTADLSDGLIFLDATVAGQLDQTIVWGPTNENGVAYVEDDGTLWLNRAGTVNITATNPASRKKASFKLVVTENVRQLRIQNAPAELAGGQKVTLKAATIPAKPSNSKLTWFLEDNGGGAATITPAGVLTAAKVTGTFAVRAAVKTQDGSVVSEPVTIRIVPAASQVTVSGAPQGGTVDLNTSSGFKLSARVYPTSASQKVTWTSSNKQVLVDGNGNVTILGGAKPGSVTITATAADGSRKKTTVKLSLVRYVTSVSMVNTASVVGGKSVRLTAATDKSATNKKLVWTIVGDAAGCTVTNGTLKTKAVARTRYVTVRATAADGSGKYAECRVTIRPK